MSDFKNSPAGKLVDKLGFDPVKRPKADTGVVNEVLAELKKERADKAKEALRSTLREAIALSEQKDKLDKEYKKASEKFDKDLGAKLAQLAQMESGAEAAPAAPADAPAGE